MVDDVRVELFGNIDDRVRVFPKVKAAAREAAEKIAANARELAPVQDGNYRAGILCQETGLGWRVVATDQKSAWIEFGIPSRAHLPQFVMRRAVDAAGFSFQKGKR